MQLNEMLPKTLTLGDPVTLHGLGMIPVLNGSPTEFPELDLLDQALDRGTLKISEVSEGGSVPFLMAENRGANPVLILDGEELRGGKQNRIVNTTILIAAGSGVKISIPVSCVEAGRWDYRSDHFESGKAIFRAKSRAVQKMGVTQSVRNRMGFQSDQAGVWREVQESLGELAVRSATSDFMEGRKKIAHRIEEFVEGLRPVDYQTGAIFFSPRGVLGLELLATPRLFSSSIEKILGSFAFEVIDSGGFQTVDTHAVRAWWEKVLQTGCSLHASPGLGEDLRVNEADCIGSGLYWNETLVHFSCFPIERRGAGDGRRGSKRASASERRRHMNRRS